MVLSIDKQLGQARVKQVERVKSKTVFEDMAEMRLQIERMRETIARLTAEKTRLMEENVELKGGRKAVDAPDERTFNGRPWMTPKEASARSGVKLWSVYRYLESQHWEHTRVPGSNQILVYADQSLSPKPRGGTRT